jgi:hypothetical protein
MNKSGKHKIFSEFFLKRKKDVAEKDTAKSSELPQKEPL